MTLDKAIEKLNHLADPSYFLISIEERDAFKLGIEALKGIKKYRQDGEEMRFTPLPGETKEVK